MAGRPVAAARGGATRGAAQDTACHAVRRAPEVGQKKGDVGAPLGRPVRLIDRLEVGARVIEAESVLAMDYDREGRARGVTLVSYCIRERQPRAGFSLPRTAAPAAFLPLPRTIAQGGPP